MLHDGNLILLSKEEKEELLYEREFIEIWSNNEKRKHLEEIAKNLEIGEKLESFTYFRRTKIKVYNGNIRTWTNKYAEFLFDITKITEFRELRFIKLYLRKASGTNDDRLKDLCDLVARFVIQE